MSKVELPDHLPDETFEEYRVRHNLPHVYVPFFPWGVDQVDWQIKLQQKFPVISIYPYSGLQVSKTMEAVYILFENESQITEMAREKIRLHCGLYGETVAEKAVPSLKELKYLYATANLPCGIKLS
jgi:hypothetical protein